MIEIYALFSARDGKVRYVGKTRGSRAKRFDQHTETAINCYVSKVTDWIHREWRDDFPVQSALLEECSEDRWSELEKSWMSRFPNLFNQRSYCYRAGPIPSIPEIKQYMRSHRANCGGYRGICWWGDIGYYTVLKPNGEWLFGNEAPGWGGNIFFSDRTAAIKARERHEQFKKTKIWLPDFEEDEL